MRSWLDRHTGSIILGIGVILILTICLGAAYIISVPTTSERWSMLAALGDGLTSIQGYPSLTSCEQAGEQLRDGRLMRLGGPAGVQLPVYTCVRVY